MMIDQLHQVVLLSSLSFFIFTTSSIIIKKRVLCVNYQMTKFHHFLNKQMNMQMSQMQIAKIILCLFSRILIIFFCLFVCLICWKSFFSAKKKRNEKTMTMSEYCFAEMLKKIVQIFLLTNCGHRWRTCFVF